MVAYILSGRQSLQVSEVRVKTRGEAGCFKDPGVGVGMKGHLVCNRQVCGKGSRVLARGFQVGCEPGGNVYRKTSPETKKKNDLQNSGSTLERKASQKPFISGFTMK
ncbi:hypothetical protein LIER_11865 [Lithospermum erythrorhizon]|uniref:Uncharacterized protein n=1 Tax=Lithospermum erythrorhizon TaxID=34254 RepID=A0AAV3PR26_LITER